MYEFRRRSARPNLNHEINHGKVGWWMGDPARGYVDLVGNAHTIIRPGSSNFAFGGPLRPGQLSPAMLAPAANAGRVTWPSGPNLSNLASGALGFSVAYWTYRYAATVSSFGLQKGTVFATGNGTGWCTEEGSNQRPRLTIGRATTRESWGTTDTLIIPLHTWTRVLWTWLNTSTTPACYLNGVAKAVTSVVGGSGAVSPDGTTDGSMFFWNVSQTWKDDFCLWNRALSNREAWLDFEETLAGYPNAMTRKAFVFSGQPPAAPADDDTEDTVTWDGNFFAASVSASTSDTLTWGGTLSVTSVDAFTGDTVTWTGDFVPLSFIDETLFDSLLWQDSIFLLPDATAFDQSFENTVAWSDAFEVPPELRDELTFTGVFTVADSYGSTADTLYWLGRFLANTDELGSGRYRR